ncbi:hypothetical protein HMPREF9440_00945 [Sutterella parvirubra YIT 11816]|uniref:Uncharacterized protein n=1 Tax=Sutterella parvirubra YIT 11816 TaxID=762967 RepID=H3KDY2_9BURK|nr:hypothetical protein HMPREF9440_00945 [Sutterella parvirubra YIT 11816]
MGKASVGLGVGGPGRTCAAPPTGDARKCSKFDRRRSSGRPTTFLRNASAR